MKFRRTPINIILVLIFIGIAFTACSQPEVDDTAPLQLNDDPSRVQLELVANESPAGFYLIETGGLVQVLAEGFPPKATVRLFLTAPGTTYRDPVATSPMREDGDGQLVFNFPATWDDGTPIDTGPMVLIAEWKTDTDPSEDSMTVDIQHVSPEDL